MVHICTPLASELSKASALERRQYAAHAHRTSSTPALSAGTYGAGTQGDSAVRQPDGTCSGPDSTCPGGPDRQKIGPVRAARTGKTLRRSGRPGQALRQAARLLRAKIQLPAAQDKQYA